MEIQVNIGPEISRFSPVNVIRFKDSMRSRVTDSNVQDQFLSDSWKLFGSNVTFLYTLNQIPVMGH